LAGSCLSFPNYLVARIGKISEFRLIRTIGTADERTEVVSQNFRQKKMRKTLSLSTIALAVLVTACTVQLAMAQDGKGFLPRQPRFVPQTTRQDQLLRPVGHQQQEVEVPSILSGKTESNPASAPQPAPPLPAEMQIPVQSPTVADQPGMAPGEFQSRPIGEPAPLRSTSAVSPGISLPAAAAPVATNGLANEGEITRVSASESLNQLRGSQIQTTAGQEFDSFPNGPVASAIPDDSLPTNLTTTEGPRLRVTSTGPSSITIGKQARFEVLVENLEARSANHIIVGVDLPEWIEVVAVMPSTGSRELTGSTEEPLMIWEIPIVEARTSEKIAIDVIPREARPFDMDVEWTFKPVRGKSTVEVTEPQLSIQIAGPTEVQYGEKAIYDVTVSNPGTGTAENVSVMLPEALGGERARLDNIEPQQQKKFQVELIARSAGTLDLTTTVIADGDLKESDTREIIVRRAALEVVLEGPPMKYAGSAGTYKITISNEGDAMARDVVAAVALPPGIEFLSGIDNVEKIDGGIRWNVGMLSPGNQRTFQMQCDMKMAGEITLDAATRGAGDLAATDSFTTRVDAVADLVLFVADPKGPLPTGQDIKYEIRITNRGTKSARNINVVMHFSEGVEPTGAEGIAYEIAPGQVTFAPIAQVDPGQDVVLKVSANASQPGSHRFRAQLLCEEADSHEVAEGTTRFFGEITTSTAENGEAADDSEFKR
jgi:uncharacterized repeat protein (TIGR01451 family)